MIERFDHAVFAVTDLEAGMEAFRRLGFEVKEGGRHPSLGTRNAIVPFGPDYLELLAVEDPEQARGAGRFGAELVDFLAVLGSGLFGYVMAGSALEEEAARLGALGVDTVGPFRMSRERPDGGLVEWRLAVPGGSPWRKPWPYLIEWISSGDDLPAGAGSPDGFLRHENRTAGVEAVHLMAADAEEAVRIYEQGLGLGGGCWTADDPRLEPRRWVCRLGRFTLDIFQPASGTHEGAELERLGPGPFRLVLRSVDLARSAAALRRNGVRFRDDRGAIEIDEAAAGAPIWFVQ